MKRLGVGILIGFALSSLALADTFGGVTYTPPSGWKVDKTDEAIAFSIGTNDPEQAMAIALGKSADIAGKPMADWFAAQLKAELAGAKLEDWDVTVEAVDDVPTTIGEYAPETGKKWVVPTISLINSGYYTIPLHSRIITGRLLDAKGSEKPLDWLLKASTLESFNGNVDSQVTVKARLLFPASLLPRWCV